MKTAAKAIWSLSFSVYRTFLGTEHSQSGLAVALPGVRSARTRTFAEQVRRRKLMRRTLTILTVVLSLTGVGTAFSAQTKAAAVPAAKAAVHTLSGKIMKFDSATSTLTISTAKGEEQFVMGSSATFHEGQKAIAASDLSGLVGRRAEVRYTEREGVRTAEAVMVSGTAPAKPKAAPTSCTEKPKPEQSTGTGYPK